MRDKLAFPTVFPPAGIPYQEGMTLREHYAGSAMQGILSNPARVDTPGGEKAIAEQAVDQSDALITALEKKEVKA